MDFEISYVKDKAYFIIKTRGETTPVDIKKSLEMVFGHQNWLDGASILYDNRLEDLTKLTNHEVKMISDIFIKYNNKLSNSKVAVVMPEDLAFGFARVWEAHTEGDSTFKTRVFRGIEDACAWMEEE